MIPLISLTTFLAVAMLVLYLGQQRSPDVVRRRILEANMSGDPRRRSVEGGPGRRLIRPAVQRIGSILSQLLPQNFIHNLERLLVRAGGRMTLATFLTIWLVVSGTAVLLAFTLVQRYPDLGWIRYFLAGAIVFYGVPTPYILLRRRAASRAKKIERALPDALDLMLTCVEAGLGVDAAFALVAQRTKGPLAEALTDYLRQVGLGRLRREALEDIAERTGSEGLMRLAATVAQSTAVGTSMGDVLRLQAAELREMRMLKAKEAAARAPILMTIPLALCFLPAMVAVIVVPSILNIIDFVGGTLGQ
ncbi:MAG TPA: type II secretion system F family protein [Dehalococcoidia bacterium]|nr:type II secretion system F family protein [Dehalococcoidia bacterium]